MGREIRRVPPGWEHPINENGHFQPLFDQTYFDALKSHIVEELPWYLWPPKNWRHIKDWFECWPNHENYHPRWQAEPTRYQIYENVSEGTPISPVFHNLETMKVWLLEQGYSKKASQKFIEGGWAPSMIITGEGVSGIGIHSLDWL